MKFKLTLLGLLITVLSYSTNIINTRGINRIVYGGDTCDTYFSGDSMIIISPTQKILKFKLFNRVELDSAIVNSLIVRDTLIDSLILKYIIASGEGSVDTSGTPVAGQISIFTDASTITGSDTLDYYTTWLATQDSIISKITVNNDSLGLDLSTQVDNGIFFEQGDSLATNAGFKFTGSTSTNGAFNLSSVNPTYTGIDLKFQGILRASRVLSYFNSDGSDMVFDSYAFRNITGTTRSIGISGNQNFAGGLSNMVYIGNPASSNNVARTNSVMIGSNSFGGSPLANTVIIGSNIYPTVQNISVNNCVAIGDGVMGTGNNEYSLILGYAAGTAGSALNMRSRNIFLGPYQGSNSAYNTSDSLLAIDIENTSTPLIAGDFQSNELTINGSLTATGDSAILPYVRTTGNINIPTGSEYQIDGVSITAGGSGLSKEDIETTDFTQLHGDTLTIDTIGMLGNDATVVLAVNKGSGKAKLIHAELVKTTSATTSDSAYNSININNLQSKDSDSIIVDSVIFFQNGIRFKKYTESFSVSDSISFENRQYIELTITNNTTLKFSIIPDGSAPSIALKWSGGAYTVAIEGVTQMEGNSAITLQEASGAVDLLQFKKIFNIDYYSIINVVTP